MKNRFIIAMLLCLLALMCGCSEDKQERGEDPMDLIGGSLDYVCEQNRISELLKVYDNVTVSYTYSGEKGPCDIFFRQGGSTGRLQIFDGDDGPGDVAGDYACMNFHKEDGRIKAYLDVERYRQEGESLLDFEISNNIGDYGSITEIKDEGDTVRLDVKDNAEGADSDAQSTYILDKSTLRLTEARHSSRSGGYDTVISVDVNAADTGIIDEYMSGWKKTRHITFVYDKFSRDGSMDTDSITVTVPASWEVLPNYYDEVFMYMNPDMTESYTYPGDDRDYTVYVTNAAG